MNHTKPIILLLLLLCSCEKKSPLEKALHTIYSREEWLETKELVRWPIYQVQTPLHWKRLSDPEDLTDTTKANATFEIEEGLTLAVHTFSYPSVDGHIPCENQVARWKGQIPNAAITIFPISFSGFAGLFFEAENESTKILAWSLQLDIRHRQNLFEMAHNDEEMAFFRQSTADCTIKIKGSSLLVDKHKADIIHFAQSLRPTFLLM